MLTVQHADSREQQALVFFILFFVVDFLKICFH